MSRDAALDTLLELDGIEYHEESGFWYKFEISLVEPSLAVPHGIRYNLTLHDPKNQQIWGLIMHTHRKLRKGRGAAGSRGGS
jgi:hypothetical protein